MDLAQLLSQLGLEGMPQLFARLGLALGLGLLVGLQRERALSPMAGIRTFAMISLTGAVSFMLTPALGVWPVPAALMALAAIMVGSNMYRSGGGSADRTGQGITTEVAALLVFLVGVLAMHGPPQVAVALAGIIAVLLHLKDPLHRFVARIGADELTTIMQFVVIALVILPILPNKAYGPYLVLNPYKIWLVVVLVVGMSLVGYIAQLLLGQQKGLLVGGLLGGLVSSTATTLSYSRRSRTYPEESGACASVIVLASAVAYLRVVVLVAIVAHDAARGMVWQLIALTVLATVAGLVLLRRSPVGSTATRPQASNPSQIRPALAFALLFALVLLATAFGRSQFGPGAIYVVSVLAGLTDMDAITLSSSQMAASGSLAASVAWRAIVVASVANFAFKYGMAIVFGHRDIRGPLALGFGAVSLAGLALVFLV